jgi:putative ABC transport system permease protein
MIEQRTKEIGIRKVLGASTQTILVLVSKEFFQLILIAFLIAAPLTYWAMTNWLENYAYRVHIGANIFMLAALAAFIVGTLTICFQAIKAALNNPVTSLRSE